jgi:hypothetical protein
MRALRNVLEQTQRDRVESTISNSAPNLKAIRNAPQTGEGPAFRQA